MIADASVAWGVSPQVVLATLQKEQSLLSKSGPSGRALAWAMGCGKLDGGRTLSKYYGFGNQIWYGTKSLHKNAERWRPGVYLTIDGNKLMPSNASTHGLYKYTPHVRGNMSFWMIFWRYFGDPVGGASSASTQSSGATRPLVAIRLSAHLLEGRTRRRRPVHAARLRLRPHVHPVAAAAPPMLRAWRATPRASVTVR